MHFPVSLVHFLFLRLPFKGEIGIPYDMHGKEAYTTGDYTAQESAMSCNMQALEHLHLHFTLWNYTSSNCNTHGDQWNGEDLSIFSRVKRKMSVMLTSLSLFDSGTQVTRKSVGGIPSDLDLGGRALTALVRPFAVALAGKPVSLAFDRKTRVMVLVFVQTREDMDGECILFVPRIQYENEDDIVFIASVKGAFRVSYDSQRVYWRRCVEKGDKDMNEEVVIVIKNKDVEERGGFYVKPKSECLRAARRKRWFY